MKKRIVSLLLLGMYFFGGFGGGNYLRVLLLLQSVPLLVAPNADGSVLTNNTNGTSTRLYLMAVLPLSILLEISPVVPQQMEIKLFGMLMELLQKFLLQILQKIVEVPMI